MKNIAIVSWRNLNNAGDEIIGTITEKLVQKYTGITPIQVQIYPDIYELVKMGLGARVIISNGLLGISKFLCKGDNKFFIRRKAYYIRLKNYFQRILKDSEAIVYAVGMLKFASQNQSFFFEILNEIALEKKIPVIVSGVSVAKPDSNDLRFNQLVKALNNSCVKLITTRDGSQGVELLNKYYVKRQDIVVKSIGDPALLLKNYYKIESSDMEHFIGLGLIRGRIFNNYGKEFSEKELVEIYSRLIRMLEKRKVDWCLFSNGMKDDYKFGIDLLKKNRISTDKLLKNPENAEELLSIINGLDIVIAARLHASIISTALDKPVTGFCWEDKIRCFARETQQLEFFLDLKELSAENILGNVKKAKQNKKNYELIESLRKETINSFIQIGEIIDEFKS